MVFKERCVSKNVTWLSGEFKNAKVHLHFKCNVCNTEFDKIPDLIKTQDYPCPECALKEKALKHRSKVKGMMDKRFHELGLDDNYEIVEYPEIVRDSATFRHLVCGNTIHTSLQNLSRTTKGIKGIGSGCEYCSGRHTYTDEEIKAYLVKERPTYEFVSLYMNKSHHLTVKVKHLLCGNIKDMQVNYFMRGEGCQQCNISGGEETIKYALDNIGISYIYQKGYPGSELSNSIKYDFFLPISNTLIEYDGIQHFMAIGSWGGQEGLKVRQENDSLKDKFAIKNNIHLIRIPYLIRGNSLVKLMNDIVSGNDSLINKYEVKQK